MEHEEFDFIKERLQDAENNGLSVEVIIFALKGMKANPKLSVQEAFEYGCSEWDI